MKYLLIMLLLTLSLCSGCVAVMDASFNAMEREGYIKYRCSHCGSCDEHHHCH